MDGTIRHVQQQNRGPSYNLWAQCPREAIMADYNMGAFIRDDFANTPKLATTVSQSGYTSYQDTSVTIQGVASEKFGVMRIATPATDNSEGSFQTGGTACGLSKISATAGDIHQLWFETRVRFVSVSDYGAFIGLMEENSALADVLVDNTGELVSKDALGFHVLAAAPTALTGVHRLAGGAKVTAVAAAQTLAANTWYKLGLHFNGRQVWYYVDGVKVGSPVLPSATGFPLDQMLAPIWALKTGEAAVKSLDADWYELFVQY